MVLEAKVEIDWQQLWRVVQSLASLLVLVRVETVFFLDEERDSPDSVPDS